MSPIPALLLTLVALLCSAFGGRFLKHTEQGKLATLDGLRGFLAFFVFIHHASIWFVYLKSGVWARPTSNLYSFLGSGSVILFFMITSFLFFSKLLNTTSNQFDWQRLYISRLLRIAPLYFFVITIMFLIVGILTQFTLQTSLKAFLERSLHWLLMGIISLPDINGLNDTRLLTAGVLWTLTYEWLFYFLLPALGHLLRLKVPKQYGLVVVVGVYLMSEHWHLFLFLPFVLGCLAAYLSRIDFVKKTCSHKALSVVCFVSVATLIYFFNNPIGLIPDIILFVVFLIIVNGNTLFGLLTTRAARALGDISYSIYLLHGLCLAITFYFVMGIDTVKNLSETQYWLLMLCMTPVLIGISTLTYTFIEHPAIRATQRISERLKAMCA